MHIKHRLARTLAALAALVVAPVAVAVITEGAAGAVTDDAGFRTAFGTATTTDISIDQDFSQDCGTGAFTRNSTSLQPVTIHGNGHTITGCPGTEAFLVQNGNGAITIENLTIQGSEGAITSLGEATLTNTIVNNSTSPGDITAISASPVTLMTSIVSQTTSPTNARAIAGFGPISLTDSIIVGTDGGDDAVGIAAQDAVTLLRSGVVNTIGDTTSSTGISTQSGNVTLTDSFVDQTHSDDGRVAGVQADTGNLDLSTSSVVDSHGAQDTFGLFSSSGTIDVTTASVLNTVSDGGEAAGIWAEQNVARVSSSGIAGTHAPDGAAIGVLGGLSVVMIDALALDTLGAGQAVGVGSEVGDITMVRSDAKDTRAANTAFGVIGDEVSVSDGNVGPTTGGEFAAGVGGVTDTAIVRSTIANTNAPMAAGITAEGPVTVTNSTISNNSGFGIASENDVTVTYSDLVGNGGIIPQGPAAGATGGVMGATAPGLLAVGAQQSGPGQITTLTEVFLFGSVLSDPLGEFENCAAGGPITSYGYNFADDVSCSLGETGDEQGDGLDPQLGALMLNGGLTGTLLPQLTSPLVDAIPPTACQTPALGVGITTDQRGEPRPAVEGCDIGSVELQPALPEPEVEIQPRLAG
jgi:hypothetical protein